MKTAVSTNRIHIVQANIVLAGKGIAPSSYTHIALNKAGMVPETIKENWIFSQQIVQVHENDLSLLVLPNQMTFGISPSKISRLDLERIRKVVSIQGDKIFTGCGMNFTWHIHFASNNHRQKMLETIGLSKTGFAKFFNAPSDGIGVVGSRNWNEGKLNLDVRSSGSSNDYFNLVFNYHANLQNCKLDEWLGKWESAHLESRELTNSLGAQK